MFKTLSWLLAQPLLALVCLYRLAISPWLGNNCRFEPSCSAYAVDALREHGAFRGTYLAARRIGRCHPWGGSGYDPVPVEIEREQSADELLRERTKVLNHAYGFISRDNRAGGLDHVYQRIVIDPNPDSAWAWFLNQMLLWEVSDAALDFSQQYLRRLLYKEDHVAAVKLMLRCRLINESFQPLAEDRPLALVAAEHCQNDELIKFLR